MPSATSAALGWSVVFLVAGGFYFVSNQRKNKNRRALSIKGASKPNTSRRELKSKKSRKDNALSKEKNESRPSPKLRKSSTESKSLQPVISPNNSIKKQNENQNPGDDRGISANRSSLKSKSVDSDLSQGKQRAESPENVTGNEADDELAHNSPKIHARTSAPIPASQDISDMLEKPLIQPNILKITSTSSNKLNVSGNRKSLKKEERQETKKQRQNRQKVADAKLARAQEEKERKVKLENQRRVVREAEGRAAKDGSLFMASQIPQSSVWTTDSPSKNTVPIYESLNSESEDHGSANQEVSVLSEEEQVRHVIKETETWSVVKSKEKRNRISKVNGVESSNLDLETQELKNSNIATFAPSLPSQTTYLFVQQQNKDAEDTNSLEDSEWEVS
ncbi:hypothetical protein EV44_g0298 [Erysiphe necator]|uniref:Uncharacterized protein n=1 Tax=Uncinula necator TaxID=52586 RepID=A0A0B1P676_UNCNE|nr:hypothetical protein EV44_g0298 [Erysiphe necator]